MVLDCSLRKALRRQLQPASTAAALLFALKGMQLLPVARYPANSCEKLLDLAKMDTSKTLHVVEGCSFQKAYMVSNSSSNSLDPPNQALQLASYHQPILQEALHSRVDELIKQEMQDFGATDVDLKALLPEVALPVSMALLGMNYRQILYFNNKCFP